MFYRQCLRDFIFGSLRTYYIGSLKCFIVERFLKY